MVCLLTVWKGKLFLTDLNKISNLFVANWQFPFCVKGVLFIFNQFNQHWSSTEWFVSFWPVLGTFDLWYYIALHVIKWNNKQFFKQNLFKHSLTERFSRLSGTPTCMCRLQVRTTHASSHYFPCLAVVMSTCTCKSFIWNFICSLLLIWDFVVTVENWNLHVLFFFKIIVLYMYIFFLSHMNK